MEDEVFHTCSSDQWLKCKVYMCKGLATVSDFGIGWYLVFSEGQVCCNGHSETHLLGKFRRDIHVACMNSILLRFWGTLAVGCKKFCAQRCTSWFCQTRSVQRAILLLQLLSVYMQTQECFSIILQNTLDTHCKKELQQQRMEEI